MDCEKYKLNTKYPNKPASPKQPSPKDPPSDHRTYADKLEIHLKELEAYNDECKERLIQQQKLNAQFKEDALKAVGYHGHPAADRIFDYAYELGHSAGHYEVYLYLIDVAKLLDKIAEDVKKNDN